MLMDRGSDGEMFKLQTQVLGDLGWLEEVES